jgi:hypothetical protein
MRKIDKSDMVIVFVWLLFIIIIYCLDIINAGTYFIIVTLILIWSQLKMINRRMR